MIYEIPKPDDAIRQGDIFKTIPWLYIDPTNIIPLDDTSQPLYEKPKDWTEIAETLPSAEHPREGVRVLGRIISTYGIVFTQDCDAERDPDIALFRIVEAQEIINVPDSKLDDPKWWGKGFISELSRTAQKWFYLPADERVFSSQKKMAANFQVVIPVDRKFLFENKKRLRVGHLNYEAKEHFREVVAQYFRRYPYSESYPLTKEEFGFYKELRGRANTPPKDYQK